MNRNKFNTYPSKSFQATVICCFSGKELGKKFKSQASLEGHFENYKTNFCNF